MTNLGSLLSARWPEVGYRDFYRDLFPVGSFEEKGVYEEGRYNGIIIEIEQGGRVMRHTVTDDLGKVDDVVGRDNFCVMSPVSYIGKSRKDEHARELFAMAIDLDGIESESNVGVLANQIEKGEVYAAAGVFWALPRPTYIVSSGTGLHLYYAFERPIRLFPSSMRELSCLKNRLTWQAWTQGASTLSENIQYESLTQAFRMVGTVTKVGTRARAYRVGGKVTVDYLNRFVPEEYRAWLPGWNGNLTLFDAREIYPEWYERRVVARAPRRTWTCKRDLYEWWKRKLVDGAQVGHRYWCVMTLAVYAKKCAVPYEELVRDAVALVPFLDSLGKGVGERFTEADVRAACKAYDDSYMTYPRRVIEQRTAIAIPANKRNGRTREANIRRVNAMCDFDVSMGEPEKRGRPKGSGTKAESVRAYKEAHPDATQREIAAALGISKTTVNKWLRDKG